MRIKFNQFGQVPGSEYQPVRDGHDSAREVTVPRLQEEAQRGREVRKEAQKAGVLAQDASSHPGAGTWGFDTNVWPKPSWPSSPSLGWSIW